MQPRGASFAKTAYNALVIVAPSLGLLNALMPNAGAIAMVAKSFQILPMKEASPKRLCQRWRSLAKRKQMTKACLLATPRAKEG